MSGPGGDMASSYVWHWSFLGSSIDVICSCCGFKIQKYPVLNDWACTCFPGKQVLAHKFRMFRHEDAKEADYQRALSLGRETSGLDVGLVLGLIQDQGSKTDLHRHFYASCVRTCMVWRTVMGVGDALFSFGMSWLILILPLHSFRRQKWLFFPYIVFDDKSESPYVKFWLFLVIIFMIYLQIINTFFQDAC